MNAKYTAVAHSMSKHIAALVAGIVVFSLAQQAIAADTVKFDFETHYGVKQITVNGKTLLTGCGFGFIGSQTNTDDAGNITTCRRNNGGEMRPFNGNRTPNIPAHLYFQKATEPGVLKFGGDVGPSSTYSFATISMPMDCRKDVFTHYRHSGDLTLRKYQSLPFAYYQDNNTNKPVYIGFAGNNRSWGEIISKDWTLRVVLTGQTRTMGLYFVNHPDTRNVEFSFGPVAKNATANVLGYIQLLRTDPKLVLR